MNDGPGVPPERAPETTSVFRADFLSEAEPPAQDPAVSGVDALPEELYQRAEKAAKRQASGATCCTQTRSPITWQPWRPRERVRSRA